MGSELSAREYAKWQNQFTMMPLGEIAEEFERSYRHLRVGWDVDVYRIKDATSGYYGPIIDIYFRPGS